MKHASLLILFLTLAGIASAAPEPGLPTNVCYEEFCGPLQERIWSRFQSFSGLDQERTPGVYSGICFHNSPILDGNRAHYGAILIDKANDNLFFDGQFSFFTDNNPYAHLSVDKARERFDKAFDPTHELEMSPTFAYVDLKDRFVSRRYWLRQDGISDRLVMVAYFGPLHTILCDMRRNV